MADSASSPPAGKCRLAGHGACSGSISGEHYLSHALLRQLGPGKTIALQGTPWSVDELRTVGKSALTANILCRGHNSRLSTLDDKVARLLRALQEAQRELEAGSARSRTHTFDGLTLERALLKIVYTMWASGNLAHGGEKLPGAPPPGWDLYLLGEEPLPPHWGLYVNPPSGPFMAAADEFELTALSGSDGSGVKAVHFKLARIPVSLLLGKPDDPLAYGVRRPCALVLRRGAAAHTLRLIWPDGEAGMPIEYVRAGDAPAS